MEYKGVIFLKLKYILWNKEAKSYYAHKQSGHLTSFSAFLSQLGINKAEEDR